MLAIRLDVETERRLEQLSKRTGRSTASFASEAIREHLDDLEDYYLAQEVLDQPGRLYTADEAKRELGL